MAKSIKDIGESLEKEVKKEEAKKGSEILKEVSKTLPANLRVRVLKWEDGRRVYIATVPIDEYDKSDPYAWIQRRFAKKYGSGDYILEFIAPDGEIVKTSPPIYIEVKEDNEKDDDKVREFIRKAEEALRLKEEAIEKKQEIIQELSKLEKEKANMISEMVNRQLDMITRLYEERVNALKEQLKQNENKDVLIYEIQRIMDEYRSAIERITETVKELTRRQEPQMFELFSMILSKSLEKNSIDEALKMVSIVKELIDAFKADTDKERKDIIEEIIENPAKAEILRKIFGIEEKKDFFEELIENPTKAEIIKRIFGVEEKKDFFEELLENPQKFELLKKLLGIDEIKEVKNDINELIKAILSRNESQEEKNKNPLDEVIESANKLRQVKDVLAPLLGINPQPVKSIFELLSTIISSPQMPEIVGRIMDGMVKSKLIEAGFIPVEYAGQVVHYGEISSIRIHKRGNIRGEQNSKKGVNNIQSSEEEGMKKLEQILEQAIIATAQSSSENDTPQKFAERLSTYLFEIGRSDPILAATVIAIPKKKRIEKAKEVIKRVIKDIPDDMLDIIVVEAENKIKKLVEEQL